MEPVEWVVGIILILGGYEIFGDREKKEEPVEVVQEISIVSKDPIFERGRFYKGIEGYYISNLSPKPEKADGCGDPLLAADLSQPRNQEEDIEVTELDISCEG